MRQRRKSRDILPRLRWRGAAFISKARNKGIRALSSLAGQLLVAMPQMQDQRFVRSVIYLCAHNSTASMGLVINKLVGQLTLSELLQQLEIPADGIIGTPRVHFGGPVQQERGFVLHSADYTETESMSVGDNLALTATPEILRAIGRGAGPKKSFLALGYAGWGAGQLDIELQQNSWLNAPTDEDLLFDLDFETKWHRALGKLGVDLSMLSSDAGHA
jgi:putative transcriptional regulator